MFWIALKMLTGSRGKFLGLVAGLAFASLLMAQQSSIFCGVMMSAVGEIRDAADVEIWVMHPSVEYIGPVKALQDGDVYRIRGVEGVEWAAPYYEGEALAEPAAGSVQQVILHGLDDATLAGAPQQMVLGRVENLASPNAVLVDLAGYRKLWPDEPLRLGRPLWINRRRRILAGVCQASPVLRTLPIVYVRLSEAAALAPPGSSITSFVLVKSRDDVPAEIACRRIAASTGLQALTNRGFQAKTMRYVLEQTGIPMNFAVTVALGFIVGVLVSGQTFYMVTLENLPLFGTLKALGTTNRQIAGMIVAQSLVVGAIGYGIGVGLAAQFGELTQFFPKLLFHMPWQVLALTGVSVAAIAISASLSSIRRVLVLEPAIVFRR